MEEMSNVFAGRRHTAKSFTAHVVNNRIHTLNHRPKT